MHSLLVIWRVSPPQNPWAMIDRNLQMMDAGMRLFETEKPFGNVLGGIKHEMESYGKVYRRSDSTPSMFPDSTGDCDLFLDWSTPLRKRCISCRLEDAGAAGTTPEGEEIHRYAVSFKEGDRPTTLTRILTGISVVLWFVLLLFVMRRLPLVIPIILAAVISAVGAIRVLGPNKTSIQLVRQFLSTIEEAK